MTAQEIVRSRPEDAVLVFVKFKDDYSCVWSFGTFSTDELIWEISRLEGKHSGIESYQYQ